MNKILTLILSALLSSCGTILSHVEGDNYSDLDHDPLPRAFSGVVLDYRMFYHPNYAQSNNLEFFFLLDLPMSLVADTLILP